MKPIKNTVKHDPDNGTFGDCHRACFATILGLESEDVPHFYHDGSAADPDEQDSRIHTFLASRGLVQGHILFGDDVGLEGVLRTTRLMMRGVPLILGGKSRRGCGHSVVIMNGKIFNDPTGSGITGPMSDGYYWVTFFSPMPAEAS